MVEVFTEEGFHSISFSCEKRAGKKELIVLKDVPEVSIQLVSLARREVPEFYSIGETNEFPFN